MPNLAGLNVCRGLTGVSCAIMLPASAGLIGALYPQGKKRTLAFAAITCGMSPPQAAFVRRVKKADGRWRGRCSGRGCPCGCLCAIYQVSRKTSGGHMTLGKLKSRWTWRWCFISIAIATIFPLVIVWWLVPPDQVDPSHTSVDWIGATAIGSGLFLFLLTLTISETSSKGWKTPCEQPAVRCGSCPHSAETQTCLHCSSVPLCWLSSSVFARGNSCARSW